MPKDKDNTGRQAVAEAIGSPDAVPATHIGNGAGAG